ncbi:MAG: bifunctional UDP-N-acetylglucosamine diphosphorylase/glucosamine-1-phosphate N-acetyltransferase GlmU [Bdellovibrionales bacterium]|nr:bifunctional UDP-N-acetylglucosamine diphosphorylase/glucosamine-1-phosphate N-acetyltransferase GlmU [Bdellovibrionales bacterium]
MINRHLAVLILAAGKGTRMGGATPKVLHESLEGPLLLSVLKSSSALSPERIVVITGFQAKEVEDAAQQWHEESAPDTCLRFAFQKEQKGTGDAARSALKDLNDFSGEILILCGDAPLITSESLDSLLSTHRKENATVSVLTALLPNGGSYGRIVRSESNGEFIAIREARDCTPLELRIQEVNSGVYVVDSAYLPGALQQLESSNSQGEFYLTDIIEKAVQEGQRVSTALTSSPEEIQGVNTFADLVSVNRVIERRILQQHLQGGVTILSPETTSIHRSATIGAGTIIGPSTRIGDGVRIGKNVTIEGLSYIQHSEIGDEAELRWGIRIEGATVGRKCLVGPFAHLRPETILEDEVKIGNFVETKKATLHEGAKASHLSYLGDCDIGPQVNIGAGTITCNYDGYKKSKTTIGKGAFIGSNTSLVAPVTVGDGATIGAGSTITKNVEKDSLSLTRAEQREIPGWSKKKRKT